MLVNGLTPHTYDTSIPLRSGAARPEEAIPQAPPPVSSGKKGEPAYFLKAKSEHQKQKLGIPSKHEIAELEKLVLKPGTVSLEDRMKQMMSLDEVKRLLYLSTPYGAMLSEQKEPAQDKGAVVDLKS